MNRAARRLLRKHAGGPLPGDVTPVDACICDGYPCPYCQAITAPDAAGVWRCLCGWSGGLVWVGP